MPEQILFILFSSTVQSAEGGCCLFKFKASITFALCKLTYKHFFYVNIHPNFRLFWWWVCGMMKMEAAKCFPVWQIALEIKKLLHTVNTNERSKCLSLCDGYV